MELEQQDQIQIKKRGYLSFSGRSCWREEERPMKSHAKFAHSQLQKFYKHLRTDLSITTTTKKANAGANAL